MKRSPFILFLLLANVLAWGRVVTGCAAVERDVKIAGDIAVSCGMDPKLLGDLIPVVAVILTGGITGWQSLMDNLRAAYGDVVVCAAAVVQRDEAAAVAAQPDIHAKLAPHGGGMRPSDAWLLGGHFVIVYPPPRELKAPLYGPGGTVVYVPAHAP